MCKVISTAHGLGNLPSDTQAVFWPFHRVAEKHEHASATVQLNKSTITNKIQTLENTAVLSCWV